MLRLPHVAAGAALFLLAGIAPAAAQFGPQGPPAVGIVTADRRPITETAEFVGRIEAVERVAIRARVSGFIQDIAFREGQEVLVFADPAHQVYKKLVVRDGVLVGALLVGDLSTVGPVTQAFDRGTPLPVDRTSLLFAPRRAAAAGDLADGDTVCTCNAVTAGQIRGSGCRTVAEVALKTRATSGCGTCTSLVRTLMTPLEERTVA